MVVIPSRGRRGRCTVMVLNTLAGSHRCRLAAGEKSHPAAGGWGTLTELWVKEARPNHHQVRSLLTAPENRPELGHSSTIIKHSNYRLLKVIPPFTSLTLAALRIGESEIPVERSAAITQGSLHVLQAAAGSLKQQTSHV